MSRYARRRDANHAELVRVFQRMGCSVIDTSHAGISGWPDIVAGICGRNVLVEIKNPATRYGQAGLNPNQQAFSQEWRGDRLYVVSTQQEVIALVGNLRRAANDATNNKQSEVANGTD